MSVIKPHDITLYGNDVTLIPLSDMHLPLLYKWNADSELLMLDGSKEEYRDENEVNRIYSLISSMGYAFAIEYDGMIVGECLLAKMNTEVALQAHSAETDIRRIDILIGEKEYWGRGLGSKVVNTLVDHAFIAEQTDVLYAVISDYNERSRHVFQKTGFSLGFSDDEDLYYKLTRQEYTEYRNKKV